VSSAIPSAVIVDDLAVCMTGFQKSAVVAIPLDASGDVTDADRVAWKATKGAPFIPSPLLYDGKLYFVKGNTGILSCLDARTGKPIINQKRLKGIGDVYASPVGAAGRIYVTARDGTTVVISDGDKVEILATNSVGEPVDASPALVGDDIYIRGEHHLFCIGAK
jgi:outer membrane protein assembly factor BamB